MTSIDWMPNGGAPLLPKASPFCVPVKMMELKRRPTIYDLRGASWQLRHKRARPGDEVPWDRVFNWPPKSMHVITPQELYTPDKRKKKRAAKKGPKVVKAPPTPADRKFAAKFAVRFDLQRVVRYLKASADKRAVKAASADAATKPTTAPTKRSIFSRPLVPGAFPGDDDAAAADVDAQTQSAANDKAQPSLLAAVFKFAFGLLFGSGESKKRALKDDDEAGDAKRRRVGSDAQAPARAEARPVAGKAARTTTTGATAHTHLSFTTIAAKRRARIAPPASLKLCPPPSDSKSVVGNAKVVEALLMPPPFARPIAGRPTRKRADTPDPGAGTPPPSASGAPAEPEPSSASSTPKRSPSSSRESSPEPSQSPTPAPKESSSKSKSKSKSKSSSSKTKTKTKTKSSSSGSSSSSSESESSSGPQPSSSKSSSGPQPSSSKSKAKSNSTSSSTSTSKPSSSKTKTKSPSSGSSSSSSDSTSSSSSDSESRSSKSRHSRKYQPFSDDPNIQSDFLFSTGTNIVLFPHTVRWTRDGEQVNPWDPHCPAPPDPLFPWAPAGSKWAQARPAPIAMSSSAAATTISFQHPSTFCDSARPPPAAAASAPRDRAASSAFEDLSGDETEVDSGAETDEEED